MVLTFDSRSFPGNGLLVMVVTNPPASLCFSQQQYTMIFKVIVINVACVAGAKGRMGIKAQNGWGRARSPLLSPSPFDSFHEGKYQRAYSHVKSSLFLIPKSRYQKVIQLQLKKKKYYIFIIDNCSETKIGSPKQKELTNTTKTFKREMSKFHVDNQK